MEHSPGYHKIGHKARFKNFKKIEIIPSILSDHSGMKLEINYKEKARKYKNVQGSNNMLLNNQWGKEEIKGEI